MQIKNYDIPTSVVLKLKFGCGNVEVKETPLAYEHGLPKLEFNTEDVVLLSWCLQSLDCLETITGVREFVDRINFLVNRVNSHRKTE